MTHALTKEHDDHHMPGGGERVTYADDEEVRQLPLSEATETVQRLVDRNRHLVGGVSLYRVKGRGGGGRLGGRCIEVGWANYLVIS